MGSVRFQMDMDQAQMVELENLMKLCGIGTKKELFNTALTLLAWTVGEWQANRIIVSLDEKSKTRRELDMPMRSVIQKLPKLRVV